MHLFDSREYVFCPLCQPKKCIVAMSIPVKPELCFAAGSDVILIFSHVMH